MDKRTLATFIVFNGRLAAVEEILIAMSQIVGTADIRRRVAAARELHVGLAPAEDLERAALLVDQILGFVPRKG